MKYNVSVSRDRHMLLRMPLLGRFEQCWKEGASYKMCGPFKYVRLLHTLYGRIPYLGVI
jgi:hypothetical protein